MEKLPRFKRKSEGDGEMNFTKLFDMQHKLDKHIVREKVLEGCYLLPEKILALQVELGELANEWRGFKFWSEDREPRTRAIKSPTMSEEDKDYYNPLLEEYVDCLHFILSIGLELPINIKGLEELMVFDTYPERTVMFIFNKLYKEISILPTEDEDEALGAYYNSFQWLLELGFKLGYTWERVESAYISKNETNHSRQNNGY